MRRWGDDHSEARWLRFLPVFGQKVGVFQSKAPNFLSLLRKGASNCCKAWAASWKSEDVRCGERAKSLLLSASFGGIGGSVIGDFRFATGWGRTTEGGESALGAKKGVRVSSNALWSRGDRIRTCDPLVPNQVRYQLRYAPRNLIFRVQR